MTENKLKDMGPSELEQELNTHQERLHRLGFNHTVTPLGNPMELRGLRRSIAKIKTELRAREIVAKQ